MICANRLALMVFFACLTFACTHPNSDPEPSAATRPILTDGQVQKYINSYHLAYAMMSDYWGERRYSAPNKMLAAPHTLERAVQEMRAAGKLPDFELLLQSHGFDSIEAWKATGDRIAYAYMILRLEITNPANLVQLRETHKEQMASIAAHRLKLQTQDTTRSRTELENLDMMQKQVERGLQAEADVVVLRPHYAEFDALNKQIIQRERQ